jgi:hypothetical protein
VKLAFSFVLELTEAEMAANPNLVGGLDFTALVMAVNSVKSTLQSLQTRLTNVAPQAGSTDPTASAAAQAEIQTLASQLNDAVTALDKVNTTAQAAAGTGTTPAPPTPVASTPVTDVTAGQTPAPTPATPTPTETGGNVPPATPGGTTGQ